MTLPAFRVEPCCRLDHSRGLHPMWGGSSTRPLEFAHLGTGGSIIFQSDEAPKARFITAWGNAPGSRFTKIIKG